MQIMQYSCICVMNGDIGSLSFDFKAEKKLPATLLYTQKH